VAFRTAATNFSKGELSDELLGRFDVSAYNAGLKRARNVCILKYGGVTKRPGTRLVAEVYDASQPVRLVPFQFSLEQAYALEMGQGYMRPAALGGVVLHEELVVTGITNSFPATISAAYHSYAAGDQVILSGQLGMTEINGRILTVLASTGTNTFTVHLDTGGFGVWTGSTGGIVRSGAPDPAPAPPPVPPVVPPSEPPPVYGGGGTDRRNPDGSYP
jgi:hypothetical protein